MKIFLEAIEKKDIGHLIKNAEKAIGTSSIMFHERYYRPSQNRGFVYFLVKDSEVVYIGSSQRPQRIGEHQRDKDFDSAYHIACDNYTEIELLLISEFQTKYNKCWLAQKGKGAQ